MIYELGQPNLLSERLPWCEAMLHFIRAFGHEPWTRCSSNGQHIQSLPLFERSEFLIDTSQKKSLRVCPVCPCVRLILVLVWGRQTVYGQNTVYLCLSKYIVFENTHTLNNSNLKQCACNNCNGL